MLETSRGNDWRVMASTALERDGAFALHWLVPNRTAVGPLKLRLILRWKSRRLAATPPREAAVAPSGTACNPPAAPGTVPAGDGWIVGGLYGEGGPPPGAPRCAAGSYTVTAGNLAGTVAKSETVPADDSYSLVVPAGRYILTSGACHGTATVAAGRQTDANIYCRYP